MSRAHTEEEIRELFLKHVWKEIDYFSEKYTEIPRRDLLAKFAFSFLSLLDGAGSKFPSFILAPCPCEEDKEFHISRGENYFPENQSDSIQGDIAGYLHDEFHRFDPKKTA